MGTVVQAPEIAGINNLTLETIIMSDGTEVAINQSVAIEVLPEEPIVDDLVVDGNIEDDNINIDAEFTIKDIDNTLESGKVILYDENNEIIREDYVKTNELVKLKYDLLEEKVYTLKVLKYTKSRPREAELVNEVIDLRRAREKFINNYNLIEGINHFSLISEVEEDNSSSENNDNEKDLITSNSTTNSSISTSGRIKSDAGETPKKTISVSIPTSIAFTVNKDAEFMGANINITNNGEVPVDISAIKFMDYNIDEGIKLITTTDVRTSATTKNTESVGYRRNEINLYLEGNLKKVYLGHEKIVSQLGEQEASEAQKKIAKVLANSSTTLTLNGVAGQNPLEVNKPIKDTFRLTLRIKKSSE